MTVQEVKNYPFYETIITKLMELNVDRIRAEELIQEELIKANEELPALNILDNEDVVEYIMNDVVDDVRHIVSTESVSTLIDKLGDLEEVDPESEEGIQQLRECVSLLRRLLKKKRTKKIEKLTSTEMNRIMIENMIGDSDMYIMNARKQWTQGFLADVLRSVELDELTRGNYCRAYADYYCDGKNDAQSADACYDRLMEAYPDDSNIIFGKAFSKMVRKEFEECQQLLQKGLELNSKDSDMVELYLDTAKSIADEIGNQEFYLEMKEKYEKPKKVYPPIRKISGLPLALEAYEDAKPNKPCPCGSGKKFKACCLKIMEKMY